MLEKPNQFQKTLLDNGLVMLREKVGLSDESAKLRRRFSRLSLGDVYLGFAVSQGARHPLHRSIFRAIHTEIRLERGL